MLVMNNKFLVIALLATAVISIQAVSFTLSGVLDLGMLHKYADPQVPSYIFSEEVHDREINDELATLGRVLFYDKALSLNSTVSCASCHKQELAFGDTLVASPGFDEVLTERHSTRLVNLNFAHLPEVFWDSRAGHLDSLPLMVLSNSIEMGFSGKNGQPTIDSLINRLDDVDYYRPLFGQAYGETKIDAERVNLALTQFVRSIVSYDSRYDVGRAMVDSNTVDFPNFTALENQGKRIFQSPFGEELTIPMSTVEQGPQGPVGPNGWPTQGTTTFSTKQHPQWRSHIKGRMGCADCHGVDNFTTRKTSLTGNNGIIDVLDHPGAIDTTVKRSPSLRNLFTPTGIEVGPYMHDGSLQTLEDVMDHYADIGFPGNQNIGLHTSLDVDAPSGSYTGPASGAAGPAGPGGFGWGGGSLNFITHTLDPRIDDQETDALIAFLKTLSGYNVFTDEKWSDPFSETGELTITNDCAPAIGEEHISICQGDIYKGYHAAGSYHIRETKADGCDSVTILSLEVMEMPEVFIEKEVCAGETYMGINEEHPLIVSKILETANGQWRNTNTIQTSQLISSATACDTVAYLDLTFVHPTSSYTYFEICQGQVHLGHTETGYHTDTLVSRLTGCDSLRSLNLYVIPAPEMNEEHTICEGDNMFGHYTSGTHKDTLISNDGCHTYRYTELTVLPASAYTMTKTICQGENVEGYTETGSYSDIYVAANGCDSTRTLELLVNPKTYSDHEVSICEGEYFMGYASSGFYQDLFTNANGCDSLRSIRLTVMKSTQSQIQMAICEGETYEGYSENGIYEDVLQNAEGCDSTRYLELEILRHTESYDEVAICKGDAFWGYDKAGTYTDILTNVVGCDSTRQLKLSLLDHSESYTEVHLCPGEDYEGYKSGDQEEYYINEVGCDSTRYISIINIPREDAICVSDDDTEAKRMSDSEYLTAYPNPVLNTLNLHIAKPERHASLVRIYDHNNRLLLEQSLDGEMTQLDFSDYQAGLYLIYVEDGKNVFFEKVLKM